MKQDDIKEKIRKILRQGSCSLGSCAHLNKKIDEIESLITEAVSLAKTQVMMEEVVHSEEAVKLARQTERESIVEELSKPVEGIEAMLCDWNSPHNFACSPAEAQRKIIDKIKDISSLGEQ